MKLEVKRGWNKINSSTRQALARLARAAEEETPEESWSFGVLELEELQEFQLGAGGLDSWVVKDSNM